MIVKGEGKIRDMYGCLNEINTLNFYVMFLLMEIRT